MGKCGHNDEPAVSSVVTISEETIERISRRRSVTIPFLQTSQLINNLEEYYVKKMRCIQNYHTNKKGLVVNDLRDHYDDLVKKFQAQSQKAEEEEAAFMNCIKSSKSTLDCYSQILKIDEVLFHKLLLIAAKNSATDDTLGKKVQDFVAKQVKK